MNRLEEVMERIGSRPALIRLASAGDYFGDNAPYRIEDGVAIIDVVGPLSNAAWSWRGTTYGEIQDQLKIASADPKVRGILLNVNSPGGETDNAFETADMIAALDKPCFGVAGTMAYSAGYLLLSRADRIYCVPKSGGVGSIGVYCAHMDMSGALEQAGIKVTLISAGKGKTDGNPYEPLSASAREEMQGDIDRLYGEFVGAVAEGRGIAVTNIVKMGARCYEGADAAIAAGLADAPGDLSTAWVDMCTKIQRPSVPMMAQNTLAASAAGNNKEQKMEETNAAEVKVPTAAEVEAMVTEARTAGFSAAAEIVDLCALAGESALAASFITERKPVAEVRSALLAKRVEKDKQATNGKDLVPGITPGADAVNQPAGKASAWSAVFKAIGIKTKEAK